MRLSKKTVFFFPDWLYLLVLVSVNIAYLLLTPVEFTRFGVVLFAIYCLYVERGKRGNGNMFLACIFVVAWLWLVRSSTGLENYPIVSMFSAMLLWISMKFIIRITDKKLNQRQSKVHLLEQLKKIRSRPSNPQIEVDLGVSEHSVVGWVSLIGVGYSLLFLSSFEAFDELSRYSLGVKWFLAIIIPLLYVVSLYLYLGWRANFIQYFQAINDAGGQWISMNKHGISWQNHETLFPEPVYDFGMDVEKEEGYEDKPVKLPTSVPSRDASIKTFIAWERANTKPL